MQTFKCGFDIRDYEDIIPAYPKTDEEFSRVINMEYDDPLDQKWSKPIYPNIITRDYIYEQVLRVKQGVWILIKGMPIWFPPNFYQFLQFGNASGKPPEFRLKRLKNVYEKIRVRKDARFLGTYNIKNRQDGDTTFAMNDSLWEVHAGELDNGSVCIQSKTRSDAINPCWFSMQSQWNGYPMLLKDSLYSHFISGDNIAETLKFQVKADPNNPNDLGKNVVLMYGPAVYNAFDGKTNVRKLILDEVNKWIECPFLKTFYNYKKFMMPGKERKGLFDIISSPADKAGKHNDDAYIFFKNSNPNRLNPETGSTFSRIKRLYSSPLDGIDGFYDDYGDADPQEIFEHIQRERKSCKKEDLMEEVRGFPLPKKGTQHEPDEDEIFGSTDTESVFINIKGIKEQRIKILDDKPARQEYGIYQWPQNIPYSGEPIWVPSGKDSFNDHDSRFCRTETEMPTIELANIRIPPDLGSIMRCLGIDPFNLRYGTKNKVTGSQGAGVCWNFRDLANTGKNDFPSLAYLSRPPIIEIFYEDMIKACVAQRAMGEYENSNDGLERYFEDNGFISWLLVSAKAKPEFVQGEWKIRRGDAPAGNGSSKYLNEGIDLINGITGLPYLPTDPYLLEFFNIEEVLEDLEIFDKGNTQKSHLTMALIKALMGKNKIKFTRQQKTDAINNQLIENLID